MADATTTDATTNSLAGTGLNSLSSLLGNYFSSQALNQAQAEMATAYGAAGQYIGNAGQQAQVNQSPYMQLGQAAMQGLPQAQANLAAPYTVQQFQNSGYGQAAQLGSNQADAQLKAMQNTVGMYGSGNMANALSQNDLTTMMQGYGTANTANLAQNQAALTGLYNQASLGQTGTQSATNSLTGTAQDMAGIAQAQGLTNANMTAGQNALLGSSLQALTAAGQAALTKYQSGQQLSAQDIATLQDQTQVTASPLTLGNYINGTSDTTNLFGSGGLNYDYNSSLSGISTVPNLNLDTSGTYLDSSYSTPEY